MKAHSDLKKVSKKCWWTKIHRNSPPYQKIEMYDSALTLKHSSFGVDWTQ